MSAGRWRAIENGDTVDHTYTGRTITTHGERREVSEEEYRALGRAAHVKQMTVEAFVAATCKGSTVEGARSQLRRAILPHLPDGYYWPVTLTGRSPR